MRDLVLGEVEMSNVSITHHSASVVGSAIVGKENKS